MCCVAPEDIIIAKATCALVRGIFAAIVRELQFPHRETRPIQRPILVGFITQCPARARTCTHIFVVQPHT